MQNNTVVVFEGPSEFDRQPVFVTLTGLAVPSTNVKTGAMLQTYIMRADVDPITALRTGADASVCGGCDMRPNRRARQRGRLERLCYVQAGQAPMSIYRAYRAHRYCVVDLVEASQLVAGRLVRLGSYGDMAAVPEAVCEALVHNAAGYTGYTHSWQSPRFVHLRKWCQASVSTDVMATRANLLGWRTFRVRPEGDYNLHDREVRCPAAKESGKVATCATCMSCGGTGNPESRNVSIMAHGAGKRRIAA